MSRLPRSVWEVFRACSDCKSHDAKFKGFAHNYRIPPWRSARLQDVCLVPNSIGIVSRYLENLQNDSSEQAFEEQFANFICASNAIEDAGLSQPDTLVLVKELLADKTLSEYSHDSKSTKEVLQHVHAFLFMKAEVALKGELSEDALLRCHRILMDGIPSEDGFDGYQGSYRSCQLVIGCPLRLSTGEERLPMSPELINDALQQWRVSYNNALTSFQDPIAEAAALKIKLLDIHPFLDGNGRMSRLLFNTLIGRYYPHTLVTFGETAKRRRRYQEAVRESIRRTAPGIFAFFSSRHAAESCIRRLENARIVVGVDELPDEVKDSILVLKRMLD
ncbi:hypothetical protein TWF696_000254 [Orbilia brochopaga]|uniref:Fido domain-containing protein n=1 Tax=Orbilia brochopaga TaxID=3140254 RepID=A0AAV9VCB7_9PEZI